MVSSEGYTKQCARTPLEKINAVWHQIQPIPGMLTVEHLAPAGYTSFPTLVPILWIILQAPIKQAVSLE